MESAGIKDEDGLFRPSLFRPSWGTDFLKDGHVRFRLWAPGEKTLSLRLDGELLPMTTGADGWFETVVANVRSGQAYQYILADGMAVPDPASCAQRDDAHGPSVVVDPASYRWVQSDWRGRPWHEAVIYELHIGTFTSEGTFRAAAGRLAHLARLGITAIEIMPVAQFGGRRGWGYDGVFLYAPHNVYGTPDEMKAFIDAAHGHGLMVFLDVVYNHFGPDGNYLQRYAPAFFHADKHTPWGAGIAFEEPPVRDYFIGNALYWLSEFRLDGLRFDAIDRIDDDLIVEIAAGIRARFADRHVHLVTEDSRNLTDLRRPGKEGTARLYDGDWNDDYHHAAHALATGEAKGYYTDFGIDPLEKLARALADGYIFPGKSPKGGENQSLSPASFVSFLQNHDQTGNRAFGERLISLTSPEMLKALMAITMLSPHIPLIFMGEEFGETRPFHFFTDYSGELAKAVREGRRKEVDNFGGLPKGRSESELPDPNAQATMDVSRLDWARADTSDGRAWTAFLQELIRLRNQFLVPLLARSNDETASGHVLSAERGMLAVDWRLGDSRLELRANLGTEPGKAAPIRGDTLYAEPGQSGFDQTAKDWMPPKAVIFAVSRQ